MICKRIILMSGLIILLSIGCMIASTINPIQGKLINKRVITFSPIVGGVGFINEDGTNEHYPQLPEKKETRWSGLGPVFPDREHCILTSYEHYSITANVTGKMFSRIWKYNFSTGKLTDASYQAERGNHLENVFSPESAKGGSSISLLDPFSGEEIPVTKYEEGKWDFRGVVSLNGKKLACTSAKVASRGEIFVCQIDGKNNKFLTAGKDGLGADFPRWLDIIVKEDSQLAK